ncbi:hypothetical protein ACTHGU_03075 [Chitinophagaceae bacterium MMS25-I14]
MSNEQKNKEQEDDKKYPGYPAYSSGEDIYSQEEKAGEIEADDENVADAFRKQKKDNSMGLDVPGAEDDDADELIGEEDEENNYYSLGGDNHNDLEEDNGDE